MSYTIEFLDKIPNIHHRIDEIITNDYAKQQLRINIELMRVVLNNYSHIQDVETLEKLFDNFGNEYYDEYHPMLVKTYKICADILKFERSSRYKVVKSDYCLDAINEKYFN